MTKPKRKRGRWDYCVVRVVAEEPFVSECLWEHGDKGWQLASTQNVDGTIWLYFTRKK